MADPFSEFFTVEKFLGRGAFGKVYKVKSKEDRKYYALKIIELGMYQITLRDVRKEFNIMKRMDHPNIIILYKCFEVENQIGWVSSFAIQMDYCPHGDLTKFLRERDGTLFRRQKLLQWMLDLGDALEYIHDNNVIHRDLKPDNILLDREHQLRISDFGIAKVMTQYYATTAAGTPGFVAPEVFGSTRYSKKADVFSLGKVFVCLATVSTRPGPISGIPDTYEDAIVDIIEDCISHAPKDRPRASEVCRMIEELQD